MDLQFIFSLIILIFSVIIHEVSHGYAAFYLGDPTASYEGRLSLNPVKHIDLMGSIIVPIFTYLIGGVIFGWAKPVPFNPYNMRHPRSGEAIVAMAGPFSNLALAIIFGLLIRFGVFTDPVSQVAMLIVIINIVLAIFNLVPIPPLDGSKILFSLIPYRYVAVRAFLERYSIILIFILIFFLWKLVVPVIPFLFSLITGVQVK